MMIMQKKIGVAFILIGVLLLIFLILAKIKEESYIRLIVERNDGNCILDDGTCLHDPKTLLPYIFGSITAIGAIIAGVFFLMRSEGQEQKPKKALQLSGDEKLIYEEVAKEGSIFQSSLVEKTGMTKVKVTRVLDRLEGKGLIERKRRGMTNVVILK